jgi:TPR repeat protein
MHVSNLQDKLSEPPLPSELNPLTNPALERNLGRWAQVYFSNPPRKRQQAVSKLLQEIQRETGADPAEKAVRPYFARDQKFQSALCSVCQHQNPPGHKFCSRCGQVLQPGPADHRGTTEVGEMAPLQPEADVPWLRDQAFSGLAGSNGPQRRAWKYLLGAVVLALAGFAYLQWAPGPRAGVARPSPAPPVSAPVASLPQDSSPASNPPEAISAEPKMPAAQNSATAAHDHAAVPGGLQPASQKSPLPGAQPSRPALAGDESGASDLRLAQRYLGGSMGVRDSSEAAKLLWKAVGKQNATAALLLSGLYLHGDGVPRSCDQARLLLIAAARRGAPQAAQQLRDLESQGCR